MTKDILIEILSIISLPDNPKTQVSVIANGNTISLHISEDPGNDQLELREELEKYFSKLLEDGHIQSYEYKVMGNNQLLTVKH